MPKVTRTCSFEIDGVRCEKPRYSRDYCTAHYRQLLAGKPLRPLRPYIRQAASCLAGDGCPGKPHAHGYCKLHLNRVVRHGTPEATRTWNPGATCKAEDDGKTCTEPVSAKGYCKLHYARVKRHGTPEATRNWNPGADCQVNGCGKPAKSQGYCQMHYVRVLRTGDPGGPDLVAPSKRTSKYAGLACAVKGCDRVPKALGWCPMHYHRWKRTGDAEGKWGAQPRRSQGYTTSDGYRMSAERRDGRPVLEHRLVMEQILGRPLRRFEEPHHRNGLRDDNTPENLELWVKWRQPNGQRLSDLLAFIARYYPDEMRAALEACPA